MKARATPTPKRKGFLKLPNYTGGKKAFMEFVYGNIVYPEEAIENCIEGMVHAEYEVDNLGKISEYPNKKRYRFWLR